MGEVWMSAADAASALGVQVPTVYAYVSRGDLSREKVPGPDGRLVSRLDRAQVLALAHARRPARSSRVADLIESDVTQLDPAGALAYRGTDIADLVKKGFEATVRVLLQTDAPWPTAMVPSDQPRARQSDEAPPAWDALEGLDCIRYALLWQAGRDPDRADVSASHCRRVGLLAVETACAAITKMTSGSGTVAERLVASWTAPVPLWGPVEPMTGGVTVTGDPVRVQVPDEVVRGVDAALCVLADHDLTGSTLATRAAAGVRADPWMALLAGHAVLGVTRQGAASLAVVELLRRWRAGQRDLSSHIPAAGGRPHGFGHLVYEGPDPRAVTLLHAARAVDPSVVDDTESLIVEVARHCSAYPNVDIGLAALILAAGLPNDAGTTLYGVARLAGLAAHAVEEYPHEVRLRPSSAASRPRPPLHEARRPGGT